MLDAQFPTKVEYQCGKAGRRLAPANKRGVAFRVGIESPHQGCQPIRWCKRLYPPSAVFGSVFDDGDPGGRFSMITPVDFERGVVGAFHRSAEIHAAYVAEFQFRYNNRKNADIFGAAIKGC
jgi:hypothetical protein